MEYSWPGNIRQLKNSVRRAFIMTEGSPSMEIDVPPGGCAGGCQALDHCLGEGWDLGRLEKEYIRAALQFTNGHKNRAASILGIDRRTLYRKIKESETLN